MPRQPYSVAVLSTGGRLHPRFLRFLSPGNGGTEGGVKTIEERLGEKSGAFLKVKEGFCPLEGEPKGSKRLLKVGFRKSLL